MKFKKKIIGMIHLPPTMSYKNWQGIDFMLEHATKDLKVLEKGGAAAALIENDGDSPCQVKGEPDVVIPMTKIATELVRIAKIPLGVEVLLNDPKASLAMAKVCRLDFIRTDYFVDKMKRDGYGEFKVDPKGLMNFRGHINANDIHVYADVQVKYAKMIETDKPISKSVKQAIENGANGVIISGDYTGKKPNVNDLMEAKLATKGKAPVIIGSGLALDNAEVLLKHADWAIVGTSVKTNGFIDQQKIEKLVRISKGI